MILCSHWPRKLFKSEKKIFRAKIEEPWDNLVLKTYPINFPLTLIYVGIVTHQHFISLWLSFKTTSRYSLISIRQNYYFDIFHDLTWNCLSTSEDLPGFTMICRKMLTKLFSFWHLLCRPFLRATICKNW